MERRNGNRDTDTESEKERARGKFVGGKRITSPRVLKSQRAQCKQAHTQAHAHTRSRTHTHKGGRDIPSILRCLSRSAKNVRAGWAEALDAQHSLRMGLRGRDRRLRRALRREDRKEGVRGPRR